MTKAAAEPLPGGFVVRAPGPRDLEAVTELIRACEAAEEGEAEQTLDDLRAAWERPRSQLSRDAWLLAAPDGRIVAYGSVWPREGYTAIEADRYVHPEWHGHGIGRWLLKATERRGREMASLAAQGREVVIRNTVSSKNRSAQELLESECYRPERHFWRMVIQMEEPPPEPQWQPQINVRTFQPEDERAVHPLVQAAFSDNYSFVPTTFDDWRAAMIDREIFDPTLWFLATHGVRLVGAALCFDYPEQGWLRQLAVRRDWRRRGLALALLRQAFREFRRRGKRSVGLVVDSYNRTGARELYERAGMKSEREHQAYEKRLR